MLLHNAKGGYSFLRGIAPYSAGVVSDSGFEIVHARFRRPVPFDRGFELACKHVVAAGRPVQGLCAMELRSPEPYSFSGFDAFNARYAALLRGTQLFLDGDNPIARTNVAPAIGAPAEPSLYAFSYTAPCGGALPRTFVVAGGGELPEGSLNPNAVIRRGEISADALAEKVRFVMGLMTNRLDGLGVSWDLATVTGVYTVHPICALLEREIVKPMKGALHGALWHYARPPIVSIEYEMDVRGCRRELVIEI